MTKERIEMVPLNLIDRPAKISRELIDPERVRELAESIREIGLLEPVILAIRNGRYEMAAGDRRYLAHKLLGLLEIKAIVRDLDDREIIIIRATENLQRVNLTPSEEGAVYALMKDEGKMGVEQICKRTGKSRKTVDRYIWFSRFPEDIRRAVDLKQISLNTLETLSEIEDPEAFRYHFDMGAANGITDKVARLWVDDYIKTKTGTYVPEDGGVPLRNIPTEARPAFVTCDVCSGPVEIRQARSVLCCPVCIKDLRKS